MGSYVRNVPIYDSAVFLFSFHSRTGLYDGFPPAAGSRGHEAPQLPRAALCMGGGGGGGGGGVGTAAAGPACTHRLSIV